MFSSSPNYNKLKTNLRLAVNRLKLLGKRDFQSLSGQGFVLPICGVQGALEYF